jgi:alkylglycerol monooxygenase
MGLNFECYFYEFVYNNMRLATVDSKQHIMFSYFCIMFGKDLGYYWAHRFFHEWHILWVGHSVHHSGEDYNLGCALRQGVLQPVTGWIFYTPLALLGFHPAAYAAHAQLNLLFMFLIHTDVIGRLPFGLEYIFNSPSSHRMHHRPPGNCNYAGIFIIWDRMFGTYEAETERLDVFGNKCVCHDFTCCIFNIWSLHIAHIAQLLK